MAAARNNTGDADDQYKKIRDLIFNQSAQDLTCQKALLAGYAINSLKIGPRHASDGDQSDYADLRAESQQEPLFALTESVSNLFLELFKKDKIVFLTDDFRVKHGGHWNDRDDQGQYTSIGAYNCENSTIYIDPYLHPLDLAVTVYHELDHLVRDKDGAQNTQDWDSYNFYDEFAAITVSSALQADFQLITTGKLVGSLRSHPFSVDHDFTLFASGGDYYKLYRELNGCDMNCDLGGLAADGIAPSHLAYGILHGNAQNVHGLNDSNTIQRERNGIMDAIIQSYFPTEAQLASRIENSAPSNALYTLQDWLASPETIATLVSKLDTVTDQCRAYSQSVQKGEMNQYLGVQFPTDGDAVGKASIRPCLRAHGL